MPEPLVVCIMLTRDRPEMARRAVECFRSQNYDCARRVLLIADSGNPEWYAQTGGSDSENEIHDFAYAPYRDGASIGALRNRAVARLIPACEIYAHWDSDDWSHPSRLAEQVALLQASGADCVGYRDMLFFDETPGHVCGAWLYTNPIAKYALGTSLMYWRKTWERVPFDDVQKGEDERFCRRVGNVLAVSSAASEPRMIASVHGGNTSGRIAVGHQQFRRVPEWDAYCRTRMRMEVTK